MGFGPGWVEIKEEPVEISLADIQPIRRRRNSLPFPFNNRGRRPSLDCEVMRIIEEESEE